MSQPFGGQFNAYNSGLYSSGFRYIHGIEFGYAAPLLSLPPTGQAAVARVPANAEAGLFFVSRGPPRKTETTVQLAGKNKLNKLPTQKCKRKRTMSMLA